MNHQIADVCRAVEFPVFLVREKQYTVRTLQLYADKRQAFGLRHRIFAEKLQWVPQAEDCLEIDAYDDVAIHFGAFDEDGRLLAYVRLLTADQSFMIEREFSCIIGQCYPIRKENDTCELTRFCVDPDARNEIISAEEGLFDVTMLLFKGVYLWCVNCGIRFIYGVTDRIIHKYLNMKGFPYKMIAKPMKMPDGVVAIAVELDWQEFKQMNSMKRPNLLEWFDHNSIRFVASATATA
jgi:N-acyl-L-homoserine lactone synthetase